MEEKVVVVGAGLAGSECALQLAARGVPVRLFEQRPTKSSPAHKSDLFAELVCSNSLKSTKEDTAPGLLKWELNAMGCKLLPMARSASVPAGGALAVDRERFSRAVTDAVSANPLIEVVREEVREIPEAPCVIAAGPLCSDALFSAIGDAVGADSLAFYDAAAPIVDATTINRDIAFVQSRYDESEGGDYLNCPMNREEYDAFVRELVRARRVIERDFEGRDLFSACQPVEEIPRKSPDALRFGALKPVGLKDPRTGMRPWAVVQLRAENEARTAYNLVGFQTNLTWDEQRRVFRMIPGLEEAEFFRYGVMHRNSFVDSPHVLDRGFRIPDTRARLAGQITGTEGYVEAIASGLFAALNTYAELRGLPEVSLPVTSAFGSLVAYASDPATVDYQPMHVNFGLLPPLPDAPRKKDMRRHLQAERAREDMAAFVASRPDLFEARPSDE